MYQNAKDKYEDMKSTAYSFTLVGLLGGVLLVLLDLDLLPFHLMSYMKVMMSVVMGILFFIFLLVGLKAFVSLKNVKKTGEETEKLQEEILKYFNDNCRDSLLSLGAAGMDEKEELYFARSEYIEKCLLSAYPNLKEDMLEHLVEEIYSSSFSE